MSPTCGPSPVRSVKVPWKATWPPQHRHFVAEPTDVGHAVRNKDRRFAEGLAAKYHVVEQLPGRKIHALGRLVQHQQLGVVDQGLSQGQSLQHSLAVARNGLAGTIAQTDLVQQPRNPRGQFTAQQG